MIACIFFALSLIPMHGVVLAPLPHAGAVIRLDDIPATLPSSSHRFRLDPSMRVRPGVGIEGLIDRSTEPWTLRRALIAAPFHPGMPDSGRVRAVDIGSALPNAELVDDSGAPLDLATAFAGKTALLSFIFTRCKDTCPTISAKYAQLQSRLDPSKFALVEITLDPPYDSPAILERYGIRFGARPGSWYLLTGTASTIQRLLDQFGIDSLQDSPTDYLHNNRLYIISPQGRIAYVVETAGWDPEAVASEAAAIEGMTANPFERFKLSLIASVVALCGGSQYAGIVLLELALFGIIVVAVAAGLWTVGRLLWKN
jgi:cytochrome oxidase Cu insertion factor (SCO1/SenC/PrrC family)